MPQPIASPVTLDNAQSLSGTPKMAAQNVNFFYGSSQALFDVSLTFPERQVTALIGPSGCGKSTFLRCLNRMNDLIPGTRTEGLITLDKEDINAPNFDVVNLRRRVGMVFQKPTPFPKTIFENVAYGLRVNGERDESLIADKVEESLRRAAIFEEVKDRLHTSALGLSGGQQQRLCIARVLAVQPDVLLMDEPCSAIDPTSVSKVEDLMAELAPEMTIIIVTHSMQQAARISDYTAFFLQEVAGEPATLIEYGQTDAIFTSPVDSRTEDYITGRFG